MGEEGSNSALKANKGGEDPVVLLRVLRDRLAAMQRLGVDYALLSSRPGSLIDALNEAKSAPTSATPPENSPPAAAKLPQEERDLNPVIHPSAAAEYLKGIEGDTAKKLATMARKVAKCAACGLCETRTQTVFSRGNPKSPLMMIGEAPGADEDAQGLPFVGRAGKLLDDIVTKGMGYERDDVYIANVLKCRPPNNRNPEPTEIEACRTYLQKQIDLIDPMVIIALGRFPAQWLLESTQAIGKLRGKIWDKDGRKIVATYHPAYLLRNPAAKREVWKDVQMVMDYFGRDKPLPMRN